MIDLFKKLLIIRTPGIGPVKYAELISRFGGVDAAVESLMCATDFQDTVLREMDSAKKLGIEYIADDDARYPSALRQIKNHPPIITVRGNIAALAKPSVGMVGTRHATAAGLRLMSDMAMEFASNGYVVISGMAMGTDTAAHNGAMRSTGTLQTIAVLAGGVDYIWPLENESLYYQIIERGAVFSEMPVGFIPVATNFVQRNRWVAGLSDSLILGEADLKSGSMSTAKFALEYGRDVFAIPSHPSDQRSMGPNKLIRNGAAKLCMGAADFFDRARSLSDGIKKDNNNDDENIILDRLGIIPLSESVLADLVKKSIAEIKRDLVVLELQGFVRKCDGGYVKI